MHTLNVLGMLKGYRVLPESSAMLVYLSPLLGQSLSWFCRR